MLQPGYWDLSCLTYFYVSASPLSYRLGKGNFSADCTSAPGGFIVNFNFFILDESDEEAPRV